MNQNYTPTEDAPKKNTWLWIVFAVVLLGAIGFFGWYYLSNKSSTSTSTSITKTTSKNSDTELTNIEKDINSLDNDFKQLDSIDESQDQAPSL